MKRVLIHLMKCRECKECRLVGEEYINNKTKGFKNVIELALFAVTCRRCLDAPCINVCPVEALEKTKDEMVKRNNNLCVGCKSCVLACPFGTIPNYIVDYVIPKSGFFKIELGKNKEDIIKKCPAKALEITEEEPSPEKHIYKITENVLVEDYKWEEFIK